MLTELRLARALPVIASDRRAKWGPIHHGDSLRKTAQPRNSDDRTDLRAEGCDALRLGVGLGLDPVDRGQLDFVFDKNLKVLPTFAVVLAYPGLWIRDLDTGIDAVNV